MNELVEPKEKAPPPRTGVQANGSSWAAWRPVVIQTEHGGWGFLLEPILLGLLIAPSAAALLLGLSVTAAFLTRHPLKLALADRRRGLHKDRTRKAYTAVAAWSTIAALSFFGALWLAGPAFLAPLAMAVPFGAVYLYYDLSRPGRTLQAELTGPIALAFTASSMAVMDGWPLLNALMLWLALTLRSVPSVLYVRTRIRLDRGRATSRFWPIAAHVLALLAVGVLVWADLLPAAVLIAYLALLIRAAWFMSPKRPDLPLKVIGFVEMGMGLLLVAMLALGYAL